MVMTLTLGKEAYDDFKRYKRDKEANSTEYRYSCIYSGLSGAIPFVMLSQKISKWEI